MNNKILKKNLHLLIVFVFVNLFTFAQVTLETEVKITDLGLHFDGSKVSSGATNTGDNAPYDFFFGRNISAHGDAVKTYGNYVFMTWYRGGKLDRHMMLSRYNKTTGVVATIEFPHRHTGFQNRYWIGESHNTIAVGISPLDGTIHLLYDMHAYSPTKPSDGSLANDYFRYSYSTKNAASLPDEDFTLDKFVQSTSGDYKHLRTPGSNNQREFLSLTYPSFFLNDQGDLLFFMREGGNNNGMYKFSRYNASSGQWQNFTDFNRLNAKGQAGISFNWGLYGDIKYVNGKIRIGFQRRLSNNNDKYQYQNGIYYAYSDDPSGSSQWKNYQGESINLPLFDADKIKVMEPGDFVTTTQKDKVHIVGNFDWTVTANEDIHFISRVKDNENNVTKFLHTYKPSGASDFTTTDDFPGGTALYTSGNDVYLIGLNNGRVFVEKTEGGTDNFERVYEQTSGRRFDHGVVHINNGKAYYYLMEDSSGNAQPLYLQIIDLDVAPTDPTLPTNFALRTEGETCADMNNGKIIINSAAVSNYTTTVNGVSYNFTKNQTIQNLEPGSYEVCINVADLAYTQCFQVNVAQAEVLSAKIDIDKKSAKIAIESGKAPYTVYKNGKAVFETNETNFTVEVNHGDNLQVKTKEACQGEMSKTVNLLEKVIAYPNPSNGKYELFIPNEIKEINLEIYNIQSRRISSRKYSVTNGRVSIDISDRPSGMYIAKLNSKKPVFVKLIKK